MNHYPIIIIGAGPAGICAAISAARKAQRVLLLEGNAETGKKLLLSGSGQCNFTNALETKDFLQRLGSYANYLKPSYYALDNDSLGKLLAEGGCESFARTDGKVFPKSLRAEDVRSALLKQLCAAGADLRPNARIIEVEKVSDEGFSLKLLSGEMLSCKTLIIATGGASYPQTGSDGFGLALASKLGHSTIAFRPHLSGVEIVDFSAYKDCAGISVPGAVATFIGSEGKAKAQGDLLITHKGLSGPLILDNCYRIQPGDIVSVCWSAEVEALLTRLKAQGNKQLVNSALLATNIPRNLLKAILMHNPRWDTLRMAELSKKDIRELALLLSDCRYTVKSTGSLASAMASAGGIPLAEINSKNMESRLCPGLFIAGEIMDYALPSGGFNIQLACSTGWLAGLSAAKTP